MVSPSTWPKIPSDLFTRRTMTPSSAYTPTPTHTHTHIHTHTHTHLSIQGEQDIHRNHCTEVEHIDVVLHGNLQHGDRLHLQHRTTRNKREGHVQRLLGKKHRHLELRARHQTEAGRKGTMWSSLIYITGALNGPHHAGNKRHSHSHLFLLNWMAKPFIGCRALLDRVMSTNI